MPRTAWLRSHSASVVSPIGALEAIPALETTMSTPPNRATASANARATAPSEVTSPLTEMPASPSPATASAAPSPSMSNATTDAPASVSVLQDRPADAAGGTGDERHLALKLARRRGQRQLVQLQRPVLDGEALRLGQRHERRHGPGAGHHLDRAVIEIPGDAGRLRCLPDGDHAEVLDQHHAGIGVGHLVALAGVAVEVRLVLAAVVGGGGDQPLAQLIEVVAGRVIGDPHRNPLGVHEMIRAGGADGGDGGAVPGVDQLADTRARRR